MEKDYDVWCDVNVPLVVTVKARNAQEAEAKVRRMNEDGELEGLVMESYDLSHDDEHIDIDPSNIVEA